MNIDGYDNTHELIFKLCEVFGIKRSYRKKDKAFDDLKWIEHHFGRRSGF